jgi:hypothetical protein
VLALFDRRAQPGDAGLSAAKSTLDHLACEVGLADFEAERNRLEAAGLAVKAEHAWVRWRSLYVTDPEGNTVELVCYDPSVTAAGGPGRVLEPRSKVAPARR